MAKTTGTKGRGKGERKFEHLPHTTAIEPLLNLPCLRCGRMMLTTKYVRRCCDCHYKEKIGEYMIHEPVRGIYTFLE